jgi:hypothetical protein
VQKYQDLMKKIRSGKWVRWLASWLKIRLNN